MNAPDSQRTTPGWEETPEGLLDALRTHPEWDEPHRDAVLERLVERFPPERLLAAIRPRLGDLRGADGECMLRLLEANATDELLGALAEALLNQPDLPPDRAWEGLELLEAEGLLDRFPELAERWDELNEAFEGEDAVAQLAEQLERDPDQAWLALEGLERVEPDVRAEIVAGLGQVPLGPGLIEFLRRLCFAPDPATRSASLDALERGDRADARLMAAWTAIAENHSDPEVVARAKKWLGGRSGTALVLVPVAVPPRPRIVRSLVSAIDGRGQGSVVLASRAGESCVTAAFLCDVRQGIHDAIGEVVAESVNADEVFEALAPPADRDMVTDVPEFALGVLAGCVLLGGNEISPALRYWLEGTVGPDFRPASFPAPFLGWDPSEFPVESMAPSAELVLSTCPSWIDSSPMTYEIAEELMLRSGGAAPDPQRDAGAYRFLFERRLHSQLELYRRMLLWMASFWQASGDEDLGRSALALSWQLCDAQHAVPSHPFTLALTSRSLSAAQAELKRGLDPRRADRPNSSARPAGGPSLPTEASG